MSILVTGSNGFLGHYVCEAFNKKKIVYDTIGRNSANNVIFDFEKDKNLILSNQYSSVVHIAGKAHFVPKNEADIDSFHNVNAEGTRILLKALENQTNLTQFVFISSVAVYGLSEGNLINENYELKAKDPYGLSKIQAEKFITDWCKNKGITYYILRLPLIVGNKAPGNLGAMLNGIKNYRYARIGDGIAKKSMVLAKDIADLITSIEGESGIYNLTDGYHPSVKELEVKISKFYNKKIIAIPNIIAIILAKLGDFMGNKAPINSLKLKKITATLTFSDEEARKKLKWNPNKVLESWILQL
jgi:nucleoside-diphosphate-sugar epimerase